MSASITGAGFALPPPMAQDHLWEGFFREQYADARVARAVWRSSGITTRRGVADPTQEDLTNVGTAERMRRFAELSMPLGKEAVAAALADAGLAAADVGLFAVVSCTGYVTPGLDILLARDLGMADSTQRLHIGHMGCYAAIPGLGSTADYVTARDRPAVLLCLELTSLHVQPASQTARSGRPTSLDLEQMVAHALFSDAAAAVVLQPGRSEASSRSHPSDRSVPSGLEVVDVIARTDSRAVEQMSWAVTDLGFKMGLSPKVPSVLAPHVRPVIGELLGRNGLDVPDVDGWAIHPGGPRIIEVVGEALDLTQDDLAASYAVLRDVGNASSATVLLVLDRVLQTRAIPAGGHVVVMAFGPGLTLYATLLRRCSP